MAGSPPPPDAPSVEQQSIIEAGASFEPGPPAVSLCSFALPTFRLAFTLKLPAIPFPPPLPFFSFSLSLNCDLNNPLSVSGGLNWGGGRVASFDPDPDDVAIQQYNQLTQDTKHKCPVQKFELINQLARVVAPLD